MNIDVNDIDDVTVLVIDGMLTIGSDKEFDDVFKSQMDRNRRKIVLDMTRVKYIDSLGIGQIAGGFTDLKKVDGELVLARTNEKVKELLRLTGLKEHIRTFQTVDDALESL